MDFDVCSAYFLVLENPKEYLTVVEELCAECSGDGESQFVLSDNCEIMNISKNCLLIHDYFNLDINNKKIITEINNRVLNYISKQDFVQDFCDLNKLFIDINEKIVDNFDFKLEYDMDFTYDKFVKMSNYKIENQSDFMNRLVSFIKIYCALKKTKLIIFVGLSLFLSQIELWGFIKELNYLDLKCLFVEPVLKYNLKNVGRIIIDNDLCEI